MFLIKFYDPQSTRKTKQNLKILDEKPLKKKSLLILSVN